MTKILEGTTALFLLISGAFYKYGYNVTALVFFCLVVVLSLATLLSIRKDIKKPKNKEKINLSEFTFIYPPGYYTHPKYSYPLCPTCLIKRNLKSPVVKDRNAWYCTVCKEPMSGGRGEVFNVDW
jgi:hypothetical protein